MYFSKYNVFSRLKDSNNYFIANLLTGNADILTPEKAREITERRYSDIEEYSDKGYITTPEEEKKLYNTRYLDFLKTRENDEVQLFFVPWYTCNFACSYCYQADYNAAAAVPPRALIDSFFEYVEKHFSGRRKYITVFGGEPLLPSSAAKDVIEYIVAQASKRNIDIALVTNGYHLTEYIDILKRGRIREIQVTLDGPRPIHDRRRALKNGQPTFDRVIKGIDAALDAGFPINARVVVDKENMESLPELAAFAVKKKWTANSLFKTQLGRNYELHGCHSDRGRLFDRIGIYEDLYRLILRHPEITAFHKPAFSISRFLSENGELPLPLFDACPGCKTEWAFDAAGRIYSCTATVGKTGEALGSFYPDVTLDEDRMEEWQERDVTSIPACKECTVQFACGGGCGAVAKNKDGKLHAPDCRPVKELLELGLSYYFEQSRHP